MPIQNPRVPPIDEAAIPKLVAMFYGRARRDPLLGPVFAAAVDDWDAHAAKVADFWHSVMLTSGRYKGKMLASHLLHRVRIAPAHVDRWLALWRDAVDELFPAEQAAIFRAKAERIAESLRLALFFDPAATPPIRPSFREGDHP